MARLATAAAILFILLAAVPGRAEPPPAFTLPLEAAHPLAGRIWQPATGRFLDPEAAAEAARAAAVVLLGEVHDNADHHALQAWMVRRLAEGGRKPALVWEMIDLDRQEVLDRAVAAGAAGLGEALDWSRSGWPAWSLYQPIAEAALAAGGTLKAGGLPRGDIRLLARGGNPALADSLGVAEPPAPAVMAAMAEDIRDSHCGMMPPTAIAPMVTVQRARDAAMARGLAQALDSHSLAVLIAGSGHVRADRGVPAHLPRFNARAQAFSIAFVEVQAGQTDPGAYAALFGSESLPFDLVWFTPRAEREDPCQQLKRKLPS